MESENLIKIAFCKVKEDINLLNNEILDLKIAINEIKETLNMLINSKKQDSTIQQINSTENVSSTHYSTVQYEVKGLKSQDLTISIGNKGVPTDRQTDRQTDKNTETLIENKQNSIENNLKEASEILRSLDSIKKEIRLKFKHLTPQEMSVFSTIYQLEEQINREITYKELSKQLKLSESSIRDYIQRIIIKGIPIKKQKINNKQVSISISSDFKKITTLPTILRLREL